MDTETETVEPSEQFSEQTIVTDQTEVSLLTTHASGLAIDATRASVASVQPTVSSRPSHHSDISYTSFNELVAINDEGHPYIDINRLVYRPAHHQHHHLHLHGISHKEKLSWYVPDFTFIVFNLLTLCVSTYFLLIGISTLTWKASVGMFSVPACWDLINGTTTEHSDGPETSFYFLPCKRFTKDAGNDFSPSKGYNFHKANTFPILRTKLTDVHYFGLFLICIELINIINVLVGINACLQGYKGMLLQHIGVDICLVLGEFIISAVVAFTSVCDTRDLHAVREILKNFVHWYGTIVEPPEDESDKDKLINTELDALQLGLGCCGVDGWADYIAARFPEHDWFLSRTHLDDAEMVIPNSCCKQWWVRNIYCSQGVHMWAHPLASAEHSNRFQERIVQDGCLYKLERLCFNLKTWMGTYGFYAMFLHLVFVAIEASAALILIRNFNRLIRENKRLMRRREMLHDSEEEESGSELEFANKRASEDGRGKHNWSTVPPPTEDEIITIKNRSAFNTFMARVKGGFVSQWMNEAQEIVTEGFEDVNEDITAEERKQREKELLHAAKQAKQARQREDDDDDLEDAGLKPRHRRERNLANEKEKAKGAVKGKKGKALEAKKSKKKREPEPPDAQVLWQRNKPEEETDDKALETETTDVPETDDEHEERKRKRRRRRRKRRKRKKKKVELGERQPWFQNW